MGAWEILLVLVVALIVLGPDKLPEVARKLARMVAQARRIADEVRQNVEEIWEEPPARDATTKQVAPPEQLGKHERATGSISCDGRGLMLADDTELQAAKPAVHEQGDQTCRGINRPLDADDAVPAPAPSAEQDARKPQNSPQAHVTPNAAYEPSKQESR